MKKAILMVVVMGLVIFSANAQYDPEARTVLDAMSKKYQDIPSFSATVKYTLVNEDFEESFDAEIGMKGGKFRLTSESQEIIISDKTSWTYLKEENEVNISDYDPDSEDVSPSNIYNIYKSGYKYIHFGEESIDNKGHHVIDLSPEAADSEYFRIRLFIGKSDNVLRRFVMYERPTGDRKIPIDQTALNRYVYDITNFNPKAGLSDSFFVFDESQYEDLLVTDLRIN